MMLNEFFRVLKPGGVLLITTPNRGEYRRRIQEGALRLLMLLRRERYADLKTRENAKSRLLRRYLNVTGHTFVNLEAAEQAKQIGHFNVLTVNTLKSQLQRAGFEVVQTKLAIFIPLIVPGMLRRWQESPRLLAAVERCIRRLALSRFLLSCQMHVAIKAA
ncbi:methyltransferase domain-containing protein [Arenibaculum sp.]|jgi:ubiquinone/menaquinone biosynthesis C-methylase UbiE|uniref:methyltransferase domain-containing protein n=1 Tax=Arenibaculum sp. TaxID=2865862 RepID=UPI002E1449A5|nr:methyltransferase domain-containing protein [Arenibaculum sp.]